MTKSSTNAQTSTPDATGGVAHNLEGLNSMTEKAFKAWFDIGAEAMQFTAARIQQDIETQKALVGLQGAGGGEEGSG